MYELVVGVAGDIIAIDGKIPWHGTNDDLKQFAKLTTGHIVIMGRLTWESLPKRPLKNRRNIILTHQPDYVADGAEVFNDIAELDKSIRNDKRRKFVIGGNQIYNAFLDGNYITKFHINKIEEIYDCDRKEVTRIAFNPNAKDITNYADVEYIKLIKHILENGDYCHPRGTNVATKAIFGYHACIPIEAGFPLISVRRNWFRGILSEFLFFLHGKSNTSELEKNGIHIWTPNTTREYLDKRGLDYPEGEMGPGYGVQWRNWENSVDQVQLAIQQLKTNPESRKIIINAWNVQRLNEMALVPCHVLYQFQVIDNKLHCCFYQRSSDVYLAMNWNICCAALLMHVLHKEAELTCEFGNINMMIANAHLYENHIEQAKAVIDNKSYPPPMLIVNKAKSLDDYTEDNFRLIGYHAHSNISAKINT